MISSPPARDCYIDRVDITSTLHKRIDAFKRGYRQNVGLVGRRYMGKSSILKNLLIHYSCPEIIPVYIALQPEPFDYFAKKLMGTILQAYLKSSNMVVPSSFDALVKKVRKYLPRTIQRMRSVKQHMVRNNMTKAYEELFSLTELLHEESGKKVLLILDEFDRLEEFGIGDPFLSFSHEIMVQKDTMYIVASSREERAEKIFREKLSLLFGNFESIAVLPFNFDESSQFIRHCLASATIAPEYIKLLIRVTDGHPFYLSVIVKELQRCAVSRNNVVTDEVIIDVLTQLLFQPEGQLQQHILLELSSLHKGCQFYVYLNILLAIATGRKKIRTIARFVEKSKEETKKGLQRLVDGQLIKRSGSLYCVKDAFLRFWLKYVFYRQFVSLGICRGEHEEAFRRDMFDLIDSSCHEEHKELSKRIEELLRTFCNDVIEVNKKRIKCPSFSEVYLRPTNGRIYPVYAKAPNTRWLCQVADKSVDEEDVQTLVAESKKMRKKINRRILITPHGINLNAKLMAKQAKIMIWNLRNLNFVFDLYDKPKVII
ncbi:MAG: hypothetical protein KKH94_00095 [Candidatus Omnitrophica bacterium]|nr:hypothetical protein [Candidatus Omnitrophota bacterium]